MLMKYDKHFNQIISSNLQNDLQTTYEVGALISLYFTPL